MSSPFDRILFLQRTIGNQAVGRLIRSGALQAKLRIGQPRDIYEQEADRVAEQVMRMPEPLAPTDSRALSASRGSQVGSPTTSDHAKQVQRKPAARPQIAAAGSSAATAGMNAPPIVHEVLRSSGQRLDTATRAIFEPRFGRGFGDVRVHTDSTAAKSATAVNALAYTAGKNIVFAEGRYAPHSPAGQRLLAHELVHTVQQRNGVLSSQTPSCIQCAPDEPAGGCGLCYGDEVLGKAGPREAGIAVHKVVQNLMAPSGVIAELPLGKGRVDLAVVRDDLKQIEIGEIKPANEGGLEGGIGQLGERLRVLPTLKQYAGYQAVPLKYPVKQPIRFGTEAPFCLKQPGFCFSQDLFVVPPVGGLYLYFCEPSYSELLKGGCTCKCKERKDEEGGPRETLTGKLLKLGGEFALVLAAAGLLDAALAFVGGLAVVMSPLLALAALAFGIVFLWDKLKWLAQRIANVAKWVWGKVSWVLDKIKWLGIKIGELAGWLGGKIVWLAEKLADGLVWAGRKIVAGAKWVGGKIASAAEAVWDWLTGSGPEAEAPIIDLPVTEEPTMRCGTVAHEDALVRIDADLLFNTAEWKLKPEAETSLKEAAAKVLSMLRNSNDPVRIEGYTDNVGGFDYNQHLSEKRAGSVADWFVQHGVIPMSKIKIRGFGKTKAQYNDPEGRKKDRRVEIWVTKAGSTKKVCW